MEFDPEKVSYAAYAIAFTNACLLARTKFEFESSLKYLVQKVCEFPNRKNTLLHLAVDKGGGDRKINFMPREQISDLRDQVGRIVCSMRELKASISNE